MSSAEQLDEVGCHLAEYRRLHEKKGELAIRVSQMQEEHREIVVELICEAGWLRAHGVDTSALVAEFQPRVDRDAPTLQLFQD